LATAIHCDESAIPQVVATVVDDLRHYFKGQGWRVTSPIAHVTTMGRIGDLPFEESLKQLPTWWQAYKGEIAKLPSATAYMRTVSAQIDAISGSNQPAAAKLVAISEVYASYVTVHLKFAVSAQWIFCNDAVVQVLVEANPGVNPSNWKKVSAELLALSTELTFNHILPKVIDRSKELYEGKQHSASTSSSAPIQVLKMMGKNHRSKSIVPVCTKCSRRGHLVGDCIQNPTSPNFGLSFEEVKRRANENRGRRLPPKFNIKERLTFG
jgi:hypothetical protein